MESLLAEVVEDLNPHSTVVIMLVVLVVGVHLDTRHLIQETMELQILVAAVVLDLTRQEVMVVLAERESASLDIKHNRR